MHHSYSFNQSQYHKCFEDFHTMFHKSSFDVHFWPVCLHPHCCKCLHPYCTILAEWSSVEALLYCQTGTSDSQWVWICVDLYWVTPDIFLSNELLMWHIRASSVWGIFSNTSLNCEQRTSWMEFVLTFHYLRQTWMAVSDVQTSPDLTRFMRVEKAYHVLHCHQPHCLHTQSVDSIYRTLEVGCDVSISGGLLEVRGRYGCIVLVMMPPHCVKPTRKLTHTLYFMHINHHAMSHGYHRIILHAVYQLHSINDCASRKCGWW